MTLGACSTLMQWTGYAGYGSGSGSGVATMLSEMVMLVVVLVAEPKSRGLEGSAEIVNA